MIIDTTVKVKIVASNFKYFSELGYALQKLNRKCADPQILDVKVEHLKAGSNIRLNCRCDLCEAHFTKRACQRTDLCNHCRSVSTSIGNKNGRGNKGNSLETMKGVNHPRWNPNKSKKRQYVYRVNKVSERYDLSVLPNFDKPRGLCGISGAYQLDHIIPIQYGFDNDISPEIIGHIKNLRFIPWEANNEKRAEVDQSILDLLTEIRETL